MASSFAGKRRGISAPRTRPDGGRQIFVRDPDGYWIELLGFA
ncbi:MAG: hypothetical protein R3C05_13875 [Pirellulaceae bacterium]